MKTKKKSSKAGFPHYWICAVCALDRGGVFPDGHVCTVVRDKCKYCKGKKQLSNVVIPWVDFDWPKDKILTKIARSGRD